MTEDNELSKLVSINETGRVTLSDETLNTLVSTSELDLGGGSGSVNASCTNSGNCTGTMNTHCTNSAVCDNSLNAANTCKNPRILEF
jgi:hypothetical protein